jgi:hypothetical protein
MSFAERWRDMDLTAVAKDLVKTGITLECHPHSGGYILHVPKDLKQRLAKAVDHAQ